MNTPAPPPATGLDRWIRDTAERVVVTFLAGVITWLSAAEFVGASWVEALAAACIPPIVVVLMNALPGLVYTGPVWWIDAIVRVARSFLQGALGALAVAATPWLDVTTWQTAAIAGGYAALAAIKSIVARAFPGNLTPASLAITSRPAA